MRLAGKEGDPNSFIRCDLQTAALPWRLPSNVVPETASEFRAAFTGGSSMKRIAIVFAALASLSLFSIGRATADSAHPATKATVVTGELVDMGCYIGHSAKGEKHSECASKCIVGGMPMGVLTSTGQLYLLTMNHANPDAYNKARDWAGKQIKVTGPSFQRNGIKSIDVVSAEAVVVATAK
jgi:hypothetical protein